MPNFSYPFTLTLNQELIDVTIWAAHRVYQKTTQRHLNQDATLGTLNIVSLHHNARHFVFSSLPIQEQINIRRAGWDYLLKKLS